MCIFSASIWLWCVLVFEPFAYSLFYSQATSSTAALVLDLLSFLMDAIQTNFQQDSAVGSSSRAQHALNELHTQDKTVEMTDQLMVQTMSCTPARSLNVTDFNLLTQLFLSTSTYLNCSLCVYGLSRFPLWALRRGRLRM